TLLILCDPVWVRSSRFRRTRRPSRSDNRWHSVTGVGLPAYEPSSSANSLRNSSEIHAVRNSSSSSMSAGTSVSGTKRPPNSPNRPSPTGSGPGGSKRTGSPRAGAVIGSWYGSRAVGHPVVRRRLGIGHPSVAPAQLRAGRARFLDEASQLAGVLATGAGCGLHAGGHVDTPRSHAADRLGHVLAVQPAGEQQAHPGRDDVGQRPVERG